MCEIACMYMYVLVRVSVCVYMHPFKAQNHLDPRGLPAPSRARRPTRLETGKPDQLPEPKNEPTSDQEELSRDVSRSHKCRAFTLKKTPRIGGAQLVSGGGNHSPGGFWCARSTHHFMFSTHWVLFHQLVPQAQTRGKALTRTVVKGKSRAVRPAPPENPVRRSSGAAPGR